MRLLPQPPQQVGDGDSNDASKQQEQGQQQQRQQSRLQSSTGSASRVGSMKLVVQQSEPFEEELFAGFEDASTSGASDL